MAGSEQEVALVTGVSSGIGSTVARMLVAGGWRVFGTVRRPENAPAIPGVELLRLDVRDDESVHACIAEVYSRSTHLDALVNNAGITLLGAVEETSTAEAQNLFETNFFGVHRVTRAVLGRMRARGRGRIIVVGSIAGFLPKPYEAFYSAAKHALEAYVESLDVEIGRFGLDAVLIEPGFIRTELAAKSPRTEQTLTAYQSVRAALEAGLARDIAGGAPPECVGEAVLRALSAPQPHLRYRVGADAERLYWLRRLLPESWFAAGLRRKFSGQAG